MGLEILKKLIACEPPPSNSKGELDRTKLSICTKMKSLTRLLSGDSTQFEGHDVVVTTLPKDKLYKNSILVELLRKQQIRK
jgi:hypothetical protein